MAFLNIRCFCFHQIWCIFCSSALHLLDYKRLLAWLNVFVGAQSCGMYLDDASLLCVMPHTLNLAWCDLVKATVTYLGKLDAEHGPGNSWSQGIFPCPLAQHANKWVFARILPVGVSTLKYVFYVISFFAMILRVASGRGEYLFSFLWPSCPKKRLNCTWIAL